MIETYFDMIRTSLGEIQTRQKEELEKASQMIAECIKEDGLIYIYGSGHAHMSAEEMFYRAGGLANVYPIFIESLMLHESASLSSVLEKKEGYLTDTINSLPITAKDIVIVVSTSGRNATPIETALIAEEKGAKLITIFSREYSMSAPSGHSCQKRLLDIGDARIDNGVPVGDACLEIQGLPTKFSPLSTVINLSILQALEAEAISLCVQDGYYDIPVFISGNLPGGAECNQLLVERYQGRVPCL